MKVYKMRLTITSGVKPIPTKFLEDTIYDYKIKGQIKRFVRSSQDIDYITRMNIDRAIFVLKRTYPVSFNTDRTEATIEFDIFGLNEDIIADVIHYLILYLFRVRIQSDDIVERQTRFGLCKEYKPIDIICSYMILDIHDMDAEQFHKHPHSA